VNQSHCILSTMYSTISMYAHNLDCRFTMSQPHLKLYRREGELVGGKVQLMKKILTHAIHENGLRMLSKRAYLIQLGV